MKIQIKNYLFDASARTITFSDYETIDIDSVLYIIYVTDNRPIYNPINKNLKGSVLGNVLTLSYDTTTMSDTDELQIYYDKIPDPATEAKQDTIISNQTNGTQKTQIVDDTGVTWKLEDNGAMPVNIQDQTSDIIDVYACQLINAVTLVLDTTIDTYTVTLEAGHGVVVGNLMCFKEGTAFLQAEVIGVATNVITLDRPLDFAFTTAATVERTTNDMNVNGSVTRQIFRISPVGTSLKFDITKIIFSIEDNVAMDTSLFGGLPKLARGVVLRRKDGTYKTIFNAKNNDDFQHHCADILYTDKAPAGFYGFRAMKRFSGQENHGVTMRLDSAAGDEIQIIVQDNLTGLTDFHVIIQGHVVVD